MLDKGRRVAIALTNGAEKRRRDGVYLPHELKLVLPLTVIASALSGRVIISAPCDKSIVLLGRLDRVGLPVHTR